MRGRDKRNIRGYNCVVKILLAEVEYDVNFISWKVAQCRVIENSESKSEVQMDSESHDWLMRQIETAIGNVEAKLSAYMDEYGARLQTNEVEDVNEWIVVLMMEKGWRGNVKRLNSFIHNYVTNFVLSEWFKMTLPEEMSTYVTYANEWLHKAIMEARSTIINDVKFIL